MLASCWCVPGYQRRTCIAWLCKQLWIVSIVNFTVNCCDSTAPQHWYCNEEIPGLSTTVEWKMPQRSALFLFRCICTRDDSYWYAMLKNCGTEHQQTQAMSHTGCLNLRQCEVQTCDYDLNKIGLACLNNMHSGFTLESQYIWSCRTSWKCFWKHTRLEDILLQIQQNRAIILTDISQILSDPTTLKMIG